MKGDYDVAKLLIKHGATEVRDENGKKELFEFRYINQNFLF